MKDKYKYKYKYRTNSDNPIANQMPSLQINPRQRNTMSPGWGEASAMASPRCRWSYFFLFSFEKEKSHKNIYLEVLFNKKIKKTKAGGGLRYGLSSMQVSIFLKL